jgi:hypothetical protein
MMINQLFFLGGVLFSEKPNQWLIIRISMALGKLDNYWNIYENVLWKKSPSHLSCQSCRILALDQVRTRVGGLNFNGPQNDRQVISYLSARIYDDSWSQCFFKFLSLRQKPKEFIQSRIVKNLSNQVQWFTKQKQLWHLRFIQVWSLYRWPHLGDPDQELWPHMTPFGNFYIAILMAMEHDHF